ncbi:MAG: DinB family protein [Acidimicrobiales bacterium]
MPITPDDKDWTWVLDRPCEQCGFDSGDYSKEDVGAQIRAGAHEWRTQLEREDVNARPRGDKWSVLEYGCHVRDVFRVFDERVSLMQTRDNPTFANWDQDETAINSRYDRQDPAVVGPELVVAADVLAQRLDSLTPEEWPRRGVRSNGSVFTIESISIYMLHDTIHHLWDVTEV